MKGHKPAASRTILGLCLVALLAPGCSKGGGPSGEKKASVAPAEVCRRWCERLWKCQWEKWHGKNTPALPALKQEGLAKCNNDCDRFPDRERSKAGECLAGKGCTAFLKCGRDVAAGPRVRVVPSGRGAPPVAGVPGPGPVEARPRGPAPPAVLSPELDRLCRAYSRKTKECADVMVDRVLKASIASAEQQTRKMDPAQRKQKLESVRKSHEAVAPAIKKTLTGAVVLRECRATLLRRGAAAEKEIARAKKCLAEKDCKAFAACMMPQRKP